MPVAKINCIDCKNNFYAHKNNVRCYECKIIYYKNMALHNQLKTNYKITLEQYLLMIDLQENKCAICKCEEKIRKRLSVDHCHITGDIRNLLCLKCNSRVGICGINRHNLDLDVIMYLNSWNDTCRFNLSKTPP